MQKLSLLVGLLWGLSALAQTSEVRTAAPSLDVREAHKIGVMVGLGAFYPSLLGLTFGYHLNKDVRLSLGYGEVEMTTGISVSNAGLKTKTIKATTYDLGADYFLMEDRLRPIIGVHAASLNIEGDGEINLQGFTKSGVHAYSSLGIDWVADNGFQIGTGMNVSFLGASGGSFYINSGYYW